MNPVVTDRDSDPDIGVSVRNIGGIEEAEVTIGSSVTVLSGQNATNRTSFLRSIMAALGSDRPALKSDADEGEVTLSIGDETYSRTYERRGDGIVSGGEPYVDDPTAADLFAFLLGDNVPRNAVHGSAELREVMLRPIDTDRLEREIERLRTERSEIDERLEELERRERRLPGLEEERRRLDDEIEAQEADLEDARETLDELDADLGESRVEEEELDGALEELRDERERLKRVRYDLETERESLEELRSELDERTTEREAIETVPEGRPAELSDRIDGLRSEQSELEGTINELATVIEFNESLLDEDGRALFDADDDGSVTDELLPGESTVSCWTCGTTVAVDRVESTLDQLRERRTETVDERRDVKEQLAELEAQYESLQERQRERRDLDRRIEELEAEIERTEETTEELRDRREELTARVEELEQTVEDREREEFEEVLDRHRTVDEREFELDRLRDERAEVDGEITEIEAALDERDRLREHRGELTDELQALRTRVDRIEADAVESFNDHMADLLDRLEYENVERVWIERREETDRRGRGTDQRTVFDCHVVREADDGTTYEDTVDHLSESERELIGLVFALAGYLVHEVYDDVPFILLDSLEAIDATRIDRLVEYFADHAQYVVVALLSEDAAVLDDEYEYVTEI